jgi:hypothetical protein
MNNKFNCDYSNVTFLVPSMHCNAHGYRCMRVFHPERNPVVGKVDGEACERVWAHLSKVHSIVKNQLKMNRSLQLQDLLWFSFQRSASLDNVTKLISKSNKLLNEISQKR